MGGEIQASRGMNVHEIGSRLGVTTRIIIGDKPLIREQLSSILDQIQKAGQELKRFHGAVLKIRPLLTIIHRLPPDKRKRVEALVHSHKTMLLRLQDLSKKKKSLDHLYNSSCDAVLKARGTVHANTVITIGHSNATMTVEYPPCRFRENPDDQSIEPLPLEID